MPIAGGCSAIAPEPKVRPGLPCRPAMLMLNESFLVITSSLLACKPVSSQLDRWQYYLQGRVCINQFLCFAFKALTAENKSQRVVDTGRGF